jgi:hypothetical protein
VAQPYSMAQQRVIRVMIRRNLRGWGKPLEYSIRRLRLAVPFGAIAVVCFAIEAAVGGGVQTILQPASPLASFLMILAFLTLAMVVGTLWIYLPKMWDARGTPTHVTGIVNAAICDPEAVIRLPDISHFITLRLDNGSLRPFAVSPELHDQVCQVGKRVTLTIAPGTEQIIAVA